MAFRPHYIALLIATDPKLARAKILSAFCQANASREKAASLLGCRRQTYGRWAKKLGIDLDEAETIAKRDGWHHGRNGGGGWHQNRRAAETSEPF